MVIYGTALLAICYLLGMLLGDVLALLVGVDSNVGGVGIGMLLLIIASDQLKKRRLLNQKTDFGIAFWAMIYIPVVVAMSASQNVIAAVSSGWLAAACGLVVVAIGFLLIPIINNMTDKPLDTAAKGARSDD